MRSAPVRSADGSAWRFLRSVCFLATGGILLALPLTGIVTLALVLGFGFMIDGAFRLTLAAKIDRSRRWLFMDGVLGILLGVIILMGWPADSVFILGTLVGIRLIMAGCVMLMIGAAMRRAHFEG